MPDPTTREEEGLPSTFLNEVTHWWDGSQIYGSDWDTQHSLRSHEGGRMLLTDEGLLPVDEETGAERTGFMRNWWLGLGMLSTVFVKEHNAIADMLAEKYPDWDDEALFQTARLINVGLMARIHTLEWTPAILPNESLLDGMHANWFGLVTSLFGGDRKQVLEDIPITSRELGGIVGNVPGEFPQYGLAEEFVSIYRLHSLLPDEVRMVDVDGKANGHRADGAHPARRLAAVVCRARLRGAGAHLRRAERLSAGQQQLPADAEHGLGARPPARSTWEPWTSTATGSAAYPTTTSCAASSASTRSRPSTT